MLYIHSKSAFINLSALLVCVSFNGSNFVYILMQTGYENFRQSYMGSQNPFDKGMPSNIREVLFEPLPPSRVDFRAEVMMPRG